MYSLLIAVLAGGAAGGIAALCGVPRGWSIAIGMFVMLAVVIIISQVIRIRIKKINAAIQNVMQEVQKKLTLKQNQFMRKPAGSPKTMMQALEKEQNAGIRQALEACELFTPVYRWSFLLDRQVNTMKMAFYYQLREFDKVDALLPKCLLFDVQAICMKMARMHMLNQDGIDKFFKKKCRKLKEPACVLPYSLYAWILVKQNRTDEAFKLLADAKKKTDNEVILHNWEALANNKVKSFSNADLGEMWYALGLEEIKVPKVQQTYRYR
ncbi:MAG: hypothetical protein BWY31_00693 [Lentisphaerae bacterium ADurb.Bin242]|nr:MAG: hypothetical protein BWY31_00693 [Lentisphaerae bacterium ADurb.Bin242]